MKIYCARSQVVLEDELYPALKDFVSHAYQSGTPPAQAALMVLTTFAAMEKSDCTSSDKTAAKNGALADMIEKWDEALDDWMLQSAKPVDGFSQS